MKSKILSNEEEIKEFMEIAFLPSVYSVSLSPMLSSPVLQFALRWLLLVTAAPREEPDISLQFYFCIII